MQLRLTQKESEALYALLVMVANDPDWWDMADMPARHRVMKKMESTPIFEREAEGAE